jgi:hypothetical protein
MILRLYVVIAGVMRSGRPKIRFGITRHQEHLIIQQQQDAEDVEHPSAQGRSTRVELLATSQKKTRSPTSRIIQPLPAAVFEMFYPTTTFNPVLAFRRRG